MLREAWSGERSAARSARDQHDFSEEWRHLERAHVLSQPMAGSACEDPCRDVELRLGVVAMVMRWRVSCSV